MKETLGELWTKDFAKGKLDKLIAISNLILDGCPDETISDKEYTYTYQGFRFDYDPDSSSIAWAYYKTMYDGISIVEEEEVNSEYLPTRVKSLFYYSENNLEQKACGGDLQLNKVELAGDCVFNFNQRKLANFVNLLNENTNQELLEKLKLCARMHHSPYNFSLMSVTGGMNNVKGSQYKDRIDVLLYAIKENYKANKDNLEDIRSCKNEEEIREKIKVPEGYQIFQQRKKSKNDLRANHFLATIGSFENYMRIFYHLDLQREQYNVDEKLKKIDPKENNLNLDERLYIAMLTMGQQPIDNPGDLEAYMNLAIAYWKIQRSKYEFLQYKKKLSDEDKTDIAELLKSVISYCKVPSQP